MSLLQPVQIVALGVVALLGVGIYGLLVTRNLIKMVAVLQILVKAAILALVLAGKTSGQIMLSQSLAVTVIVADTVVAVIGLALAVQVRQRLGTLDIKKLSSLKG
jgi:NADH:ubiquinone oxidoreductase subunit K